MAAPAIKKYKKGDVIFNEGDKSDAMYYIQNGSIRLFKKKGTGSIELGTVHKGEVIGEMGFLDGGPRSASAEVQYDADLVEINSGQMVDQLKNLPQWIAVLLKTIVNRLRSANNKIKQLESVSTSLNYNNEGGVPSNYEFLTPSEILRTCTSLLLVASRNGESAEGAVRVLMTRVLKYAQQILGVPQSKVTEMFNVLEHVGIVKVDSSNSEKVQIYVLDIDQLEVLIGYINEENLKEQSKKINLSLKAVVILGYIVKHINLFPADPTGISDINLAKIIEIEKQALGGKEPFKTDDLAELVNFKLATELSIKDSSTMITKVHQKDIQRLFKIQKVVKEIQLVNEKKRAKVFKTKTPEEEAELAKEALAKAAASASVLK